MNTAKISSYNRLIAFFLIIVALLSVLVVSANGLQSNAPFWDNTDDTVKDKNDDVSNDVPTDIPSDNVEPEAPKFYHHITGVEVSEEVYGDSQVAYVIDGNSPLCGVANCNVLIEFPIENQKTRYIMISDKKSNHTKIGSITYTRKFISNLAPIFGATIVSLGNDDTIEYKHINVSNSIELTKNPGSYYTEYTYFTYTNPKLISSITTSSTNVTSTLPYSFIGNSTSVAFRNISAKTINIPYDTATSLVFSQDQNGYCLYKMGSDRIDVSTSDKAIFTNVLILYADSMTYETADKTEMIINTCGSGKGYFAYNGFAEEITWNMDDDGNLALCDKSGKPLELGRGSIYMAYVKSSTINNSRFL